MTQTVLVRHAPALACPATLVAALNEAHLGASLTFPRRQTHTARSWVPPPLTLVSLALLLFSLLHYLSGPTGEPAFLASAGPHDRLAQPALWRRPAWRLLVLRAGCYSCGSCWLRPARASRRCPLLPIPCRCGMAGAAQVGGPGLGGCRGRTHRAQGLGRTQEHGEPPLKPKPGPPEAPETRARMPIQGADTCA